MQSCTALPEIVLTQRVEGDSSMRLCCKDVSPSVGCYFEAQRSQMKSIPQTPFLHRQPAPNEWPMWHHTMLLSAWSPTLTQTAAALVLMHALFMSLSCHVTRLVWLASNSHQEEGQLTVTLDLLWKLFFYFPSYNSSVHQDLKVFCYDCCLTKKMSEKLQYDQQNKAISQWCSKLQL